jgi:large subunit ribosomal protein L30
MATKEKKKTITIQQYASPIRRNAIQREYLKSLGLGRINAVKELEDSASIQGLLTKVAHMVRVISE